MEGGRDIAPDRVRLVIFGEAASKANSRKIVMRGTRPASIKSDKAMGWLAGAALQVPMRDSVPFPKGELVAHVHMHYATQRPDLDPSLVFDFLQGRLYANDRQVREQHVYHYIDKIDPRVVVVIERRRLKQ